MAVIESPFGPVPPPPEGNVQEVLFAKRPWPEPRDFVIHIDGVTGETRTRAQFVERMYDAATALATPVSRGGVGVDGEQDIVGIFSHNCLDYVVLVHALLTIATPIALCSAYATPFELAHALRTSKATRLFVQPSLLPIALQAAKETGLPEDRIYVLQSKTPGRKSVNDLVEETRRQKFPRVAIKKAEKDTLAYLVFSSGTTGLPKAVAISHGNVCFSLAQHESTMRADGNTPPLFPPGVMLAVLPFYHTYGLHVNVIRPFYQALTQVILPKWSANMVLHCIPKYKINSLVLIPSAIHQLVNHKHAHSVDFSSVTAVASGAAYLPPGLAARFAKIIRKQHDFSEGYGASEVTISAIRQPTLKTLGGKMKIKVGATGYLISGMQARIVRADGTDANLMEPGELWLRGGNIAMGYFGNEKATRETFVDGWLRTGDRMYLDEDGVFFFVDRMKDTLKVAGLQVSPTEIEEVLMAHPDKLITDACVAGVSGGRTKDELIPRAWIVLSEDGKRRGAAAVAAEMERWAKANLSPYKWLRAGFGVVDEIPKNPTGKVLRRALQELHEQKMKAQAKL